MERLIFLLVFFFVFFIFLGIYFLRKDRNAAVKEKLIKRLDEGKTGEEKESSYFKKQRGKSWADNTFSMFIDLESLDSFLSQTKVNLTVERLLLISTGLAVLFSVSGMIIFRSFLPVCLLFGAGFGLPLLFLLYKKRKKDAAMVEQLPDALDFMVRALRAGQSLDRAFQGVSRDFPDPVGGEIAIIYEEIAMGLPFVDGLKNFEKRCPRLTDVKILCTAFIIQRETGGNLTEILEGLSRTIRERFVFKRQVKALTAEGRLTGVILGLLPFAFGGIMYLLNPSYINVLFVHPAGQKLLFLAMVLEVAGFTAMRLLSRVEV